MSTTTTATPTPNHHQPVPHPILIPLIPSLALLAAFMLIIYLNREGLRQVFLRARGRSDGYVHADTDEGEHAYESRKKPHGRTRGNKIPRLRLRSSLKSTSEEDDDDQNNEIEMRPLMRNGMEDYTTTTTSSAMVHEEEASDHEFESFFIQSDSSSLAYSDDDINTDSLSLSKYFDSRTGVLLSEYKDPPSPVTETWEMELRHRIRDRGSVTAWVDYVVDCAAEWWEGVSM